MNDKAFYLETFGCQMNVVDSERIVGLLDEIGYRQVEEPEQADLLRLDPYIHWHAFHAEQSRRRSHGQGGINAAHQFPVPLE